MEGGVEVKVVGTRELFNLPLYEHHLVIDTRSASDYESGHIATAVSFPGPPLNTSEDDREKELVKFIRAYVKEYLRPENPNPIVIYGDSQQPPSQVHSEWLIHKLQVLHSGRRSLCPLAPDDSDSSDDGGADRGDSSRRINYFEQFCSLLGDFTTEIWLMEGGYADFQHQYGFLCGHVEFSSMFPLPHQINEFLFLGSRVVPLDGASLRLMGITHLIVSDKHVLKWEEIRGMEVLQCSVKESNSQDMSACWEASCTFIDNATSQDVKVRVLVMLFGRSRSTSIVLAYLIRKFGMSFEESLKCIKKNCWHLIDQSLIFEQQLRAWQERQQPNLLTN